MDQGRKVFILGLDGATSSIIDRMMGCGKLKNISKLIKGGTYGHLYSTKPPLSPTAWTSFMTGTDPSKHGIFDFMTPRFDDYKVEFSNSSSIKAETVWKLAGRQGKKSIVMGIPMTYPPEEINGIIISEDLGPPRRTKTFTYPPGIQKELKENMGGYLYEGLRKVNTRGKVDNDYYIKISDTVIDNRFNAANYLINKYEWDLFVLGITSTDRIQHFFWKYTDKKHPQFSFKEAAKYSNVIDNIYERADENLGKILSNIGNKVTTIIISDHGFGPLRKAFRLDKWLSDNSYLQYNREKTRGHVSDFINKSVNLAKRKMRLGKFKRLWPATKKVREQGGVELLPGVLWDKTKAYTTGASGNIYLNMRGRERCGIIEAGREYESVRNNLIEALKDITDPDTNQKIFQSVKKKENIYNGPFLNHMPDIILSWMRGYYHIRKTEKHLLSIDNDLDDLFITTHKWSGNHIPEGILIINGDGIKSEYRYNCAEIIDIAPTILYLMGLNVPEYMDGHVLTEIFENAVIRENPVKLDTTKISGESSKVTEKTYTESESSKIHKRLIDLGYLD